MYYTDEEVDRLVGMLKVPGGESYVRKTALAVGDILKKDPSQYKTFGVYWWAMKDALRKYYPNAGWFKGDYFDQLMYNRAWHGDLFRTVLAAAHYHGQQLTTTSAHDWTGPHGEDRQYTLIDDDAGF